MNGTNRVKRPAAGENMASKRGGDILTIGFSTTVVMWVILYVAAMPLGLVPMWLAAVVLAGGLFAAGDGLARKTGRGWRGGVWLGLLVTSLNLLILLSMLGGREPGEVVVAGLWWIGGFLAAAVGLCTLGAAAGSRSAPAEPARINWTMRFALLTAVTTLLLMIAGGIVTGLEAGMAVEGWLTSDGYPMVLFPLTMMQRDIGSFAEHTHRLWGLLVGLTTIVLAIQVWRVDRRRWLRWLVIGAVAVVIIQGVLGGTRVTESSVFLGVVHGVVAQAFFALLIVIAMATSKTWLSGEEPFVAKTAKTDRTISAVLVAAIVLQLTLGTWFRHIQPLPDIPPGLRMGLLHGHSFVGSLLVLALVLFCGVRAWGLYANQRTIKRVGKGMVHTVGLQVLLGIASFIIVPTEARPQGEAIPTLEVVVTTAHQAVGAILLAMAVMYAVWVRRLLTEA